MSDYPRFEVFGVPDVPFIEAGHDVAGVLIEASGRGGIELQEHDVVIMASKAISYAEGRLVSLADVEVTDEALRLHEQVPRKKPELCQVILDVTEGRVEVTPEYQHILGTLPNGLRLTSGGVDKIDDKTVILLPKDADASARRIGETLRSSTGHNIGVVISDSEGREGREGAGALAIGSYGIPPIRETRGGPETFCDFAAAAGAVILGQRQTGMPFAILRGLEYDWTPDKGVADILAPPND